MLTIYCDGGARGNPGPAASAAIITRDGEVVGKKSKYLGVATNNVAEYNAVLLGLEFLKENVTTEDTTFVLDSLLVASQLQGKFKIKNENLGTLYLMIKQLEKSLTIAIFYTHVLRHKNKLADLLVNQTLDENS